MFVFAAVGNADRLAVAHHRARARKERLAAADGPAGIGANLLEQGKKARRAFAFQREAERAGKIAYNGIEIELVVVRRQLPALAVLQGAGEFEGVFVRLESRRTGRGRRG